MTSILFIADDFYVLTHICMDCRYVCHFYICFLYNKLWYPMESSKRIKLALSRSLSKCHNKRCPINLNKSSKHHPCVYQINSCQHSVVCNVCCDEWIICLPCKKRFSSSKRNDARHHFMSTHNISVIDAETASPGSEEQGQSIALDFNTDNVTVNVDSIRNNVLEVFAPTNPPSTLSASFNPTSHIYFKDSFVSTSKAVAGMVARAYAQTFQSSIHSVTNSEAAFHLKTTQFLTRLHGSMYSDFIDILQLAKEQHTFQSTRLPQSVLEIDKFYLKSKHCLMEQLPLPTMSIKDDHAYVSLVSIIDHFLAFGNLPELVSDSSIDSNVHSITSCKIARDMYSHVHEDLPSNMNVMVLYLTLWSDDFEATSLRKNVHST